MKINITIKRSKQWVTSQRLACGENVPTEIVCEVDVAELSEHARRMILVQSTDGSYEDIRVFYHGSDYQWGWGSRYGWYIPQIDADAPTAAEIDAAIVALDANLVARREEIARETAKQKAEEAACKAEQEAAEAARVEARCLLSDEIAKLVDARNEAANDRLTLSEFLAAVPQDALRGTLKKIATSPEAINALREKVESAATLWKIFDDDADDGTDGCR